MPKNQSSMFDVTIEDIDLQRMLEDEVKFRVVAQEYRKTRKAIRARLQEKFPHTINAEGESGGWVRCGPFWFRPRTSERKEGDVHIGAGTDWDLVVEQLD